MKKILIIFILLCLVGCNFKEEEIQEKIVVEEIEEKYVDDNPIIVGLYVDDYTLVKDYYTTKESYKDLVFSTYYTDDVNLYPGKMKYKWYDYYNRYDDIEKYKIGYNISFYVGDELISKNILTVTNEYVFDPYFYIYLYDDIHQADGAWYSHITPDTMYENTMFTSIKLYLVSPLLITSPITLTAFTYDEDDFDLDGNYIGKSKYEIKINWQ